MTERDIEAVFQSMQGRVLDEKRLTGWESRQPKREDAGDPETGVKSAAERKRAQREREKLHAQREPRHEESRDVTLDKDKDKDKDSLKHPSQKFDQTTEHADPKLPDRFADFWKTYPSTPRKTAKSECAKRWKARQLDAHADTIIDHVAAMARTRQWLEGFEPAPLTYLNQKRWEDGIPTTDAPPRNGAQHYDPKSYFRKARAHDDNNTIDANFQVVDDQ